MTLTCEEGDASSVSQDPGGGLTNFCPIRENVWWLCELSNEEFWSSVTEAAQHLGCHCVSPPYCHPVSLAEVPRSLPSVSASSSLTAGVSGGHQDSRSLEMVRAAGREEEAAASRGDSGDSSGSAGPRCPGLLGGPGSAGRVTVLALAERSVLRLLGFPGRPRLCSLGRVGGES